MVEGEAPDLQAHPQLQVLLRHPVEPPLRQQGRVVAPVRPAPGKEPEALHPSI